MPMQINAKQIARLQTLYGQLAHREIGVDSGREARIRWAEERLGKPVTSFKDLSASDAGWLIDQIQQALGVKVPLKTRPSRDQARRAGLDGRKDGQEFADAPQMVTPQDIARINALCEELGWSEETLRTFLGSTRSPFAKRADKTIRTTADANKVWWALKPIAKRKGLWRK